MTYEQAEQIINLLKTINIWGMIVGIAVLTYILIRIFGK